MSQAKPKDDAGADAAAKPKKPVALMAVLLLLGLALGGGGAAGYFLMLAPKGDHADAEAEKAAKEAEEAAKLPPEFIEIKKMTVPMLDASGRLTGYLGIDLTFQVGGGGDAEFAKARLPMIRHAINEALSQNAVTVEGKPQVLDYERAEKLLVDSANRALGKPVVISAQIVSALPL